MVVRSNSDGSGWYKSGSVVRSEAYVQIRISCWGERPSPRTERTCSWISVGSKHQGDLFLGFKVGRRSVLLGLSKWRAEMVAIDVKTRLRVKMALI